MKSYHCRLKAIEEGIIIDLDYSNITRPLSKSRYLHNNNAYREICNVQR